MYEFGALADSLFHQVRMPDARAVQGDDGSAGLELRG